MKVLLNLSRVVSGGGQQVAFSVLESFLGDDGIDLYVYVTRGSNLQEFILDKMPRNKFLVLPKNYFLSTVLGVIHCLLHLSTAKIVNFGVSLPIVKNKQIVRSVFSNLYYPEIDFWADISSKRTRILKYFKDFLRLRGTLRADLIWFENEEMLIRSISLFNRAVHNVFYCAPALSQKLSRQQFVNGPEKERLFYPASPYANKGFQLLPKIARKLKDLNDERFIFVLTFSEDDYVELISEIDLLDVREYFEFVGTLDFEHLCVQYELSRAVLLLSKLECFSSSVIESAFFEKVIIGTDAPWLRSELGEDCIYVDRNSVDSVVQGIFRLSHKNSFNFARILGKYNTHESRYSCIVERLRTL